MARGRDTHTISITKRVKEELYENCSDPDLMRDIITRAERLAFTPLDQRAAAILALEIFCREAPCILWQPLDPKQRHIEVQIHGANSSKNDERVIVSVSRIVWTAYHVVSQQGDIGLATDDEILHSCGKNGAVSTALGVCLNPAHLIKADRFLRLQLSKTRKRLRTVNVASIAV